MIENLVNSKTRIAILKLFLSHIDDRYYLRELERLLGESLSPLRRQLVKLTEIGILVTEEEANLKYYKVNKNFEGLEELKGVIFGKIKIALLPTAAIPIGDRDIVPIGDRNRLNKKQFRYDVAILSFISVFVLFTAIFVAYSNNKNMKQVANLIAKEDVLGSAPAELHSKNKAPVNTGVGEMVSKKWKIMSGNVPVLSSGETGGEKNSKEL